MFAASLQAFSLATGAQESQGLRDSVPQPQLPSAAIGGAEV